MSNLVKSIQFVVCIFILGCEMLFNPSKGLYHRVNEKISEQFDSIQSKVCNEDSIMLSPIEDKEYIYQ